MTSVPQMSFQTKTAEETAFLFRNDRQAGLPSGHAAHSSHTSHYFDCLPVALEHSCRRRPLLTRCETLEIADFTFRKPLIYRLLTLSNLNEKISRGLQSDWRFRLAQLLWDNTFQPKLEVRSARYQHKDWVARSYFRTISTLISTIFSPSNRGTCCKSTETSSLRCKMRSLIHFASIQAPLPPTGTFREPKDLKNSKHVLLHWSLGNSSAIACLVIGHFFNKLAPKIVH